MSDETGRNEIYVKRFPSGEGKWQVSADGGEWPVWSRTGDRIYFARDDAILEATFAGRPAVTLGRPRELFTRKPYGMTLMFGWAPGFDVDASGERFVTCQGVGGPPVTSGIVVVESWLREFAAGK
jgi:hypothetical protein